jgi:hypothetical protein
LSPRLTHFSDEQADDIRSEIEWYLYPRVRTWKVYIIVVVTFLIIGASAGVYFYGRANNRLTEQICRSTKNVRAPLTTYIGVAIKISQQEQALHLPVFQNPRLAPLITQQNTAIHDLYRALQHAQDQSCTTTTG